ncbi:MAG: hypothetical protein ACK2T3_09615, partial [Candidatus Promineifilaceae bacterium]
SNPVAPPSPPNQPLNLGLPRVQYARVYNVIPGSASARQALDIFVAASERSRETVGYSYDDAGVGALSSKTARLYGINQDQRQLYIDWYEEFYPGTRVEFHTLPPNAEDGRCGGEK